MITAAHSSELLQWFDYLLASNLDFSERPSIEGFRFFLARLHTPLSSTPRSSSLAPKMTTASPQPKESLILRSFAIRRRQTLDTLLSLYGQFRKKVERRNRRILRRHSLDNVSLLSKSKELLNWEAFTSFKETSRITNSCLQLEVASTKPKLISMIKKSWPLIVLNQLTEGQSIEERQRLILSLRHIQSVKNKVTMSRLPSKGLRQSRSYSTESTRRSTGASSSDFMRLDSPGYPSLHLYGGASNRPSPEKVDTGGEDAWFLSDRGYGFGGVADGVGQWSDFGCNPRFFSQQLCRGALVAIQGLKSRQSTVFLPSASLDDKTVFESQLSSDFISPVRHTSVSSVSSLELMSWHRAQDGGIGEVDLRMKRPAELAQMVMQYGYTSTESVWGASTFCIATIAEGGKTLGIANLGDSGALVLRRHLSDSHLFTIVRRTKEQQHDFNTPFQLSRTPTEKDFSTLQACGLQKLQCVLAQLKDLGMLDAVKGDCPRQAELYNVLIEEGDLVILATDGILDNLYEIEIARICSLALSPYEAHLVASAPALYDALTGKIPHPFLGTPPPVDPRIGLATPPEAIAKALVEAAYYRSFDRRALTPFSRASRKKGRMFVGGKQDDMTVVVFWVVS